MILELVGGIYNTIAVSNRVVGGLSKEIVFALFAKFSISLVASSSSLVFDFVVP